MPEFAPPPAPEPHRPPLQRWTSASWVPWAALVALLAVAYFPMLLGRILFVRDLAHWNHPAHWFMRAALRAGEFPHWNPFHALGFSTWSDPLYGLFYPPNWLYLLVPDGEVARLQTWIGFGHVIGGACGLALVARRLGAGAVGATVAGLAWALSGVTTGLWTVGIMLTASAWLPWCAVGFVALADTVHRNGAARARGTVQAALPIALAMATGEIFVAMMGVAFGLLVALALTPSSTVDAAQSGALAGTTAGRALFAKLALFVGPILLAGLLAAVVVLPARAAAAGTDREHPLPLALAEKFSVHPLRLIEFVAPGAMGNPENDYPAGRWIAPNDPDPRPHIYSSYLGASVVALALLALRRRRTELVLLGGAAFALAVSLGKHTPIHAALRVVVPPLSFMRFPEKYLLIVMPCLALLAGLGAARLLDAAATRRQRLWGPAAVLLIMLAFVATVTAWPAYLAPYFRQGGWRGAVAAAAILLIGLRGLRIARFKPALLALCVSFDLALAAWPLLQFAPNDLAARRPPTAALIGQSPGGLPPPRVYRAARVEDQVARFAPTDNVIVGEARSLATLFLASGIPWGLANLPGYDAAVPELFNRTWLEGLPYGRRLLRLLGVEYAILPADPRAPDQPAKPGFEPLGDPMPGARLYRVTAALPRVYLAGDAPVETPATKTQLWQDEAVLAGGRAWLAPGSEAAALTGEPTRAGQCTVAHYEAARWEVDCVAKRAALAVFVEQFADGWRAQLDGHAVPLVRANRIMRALRVPPGRHRLVLTFSPPGLPLATALSGLGVVGVLGLLFWSRRRADSPTGLAAANQRGAPDSPG